MDQEFSFGEWIRRRRNILGLTQEAVAGQVGYSIAMIRKIEVVNADYPEGQPGGPQRRFRKFAQRYRSGVCWSCNESSAAA